MSKLTAIASPEDRPERARRLEWVNAKDLNVNPVAQREFRPAWAAKILAEWDIEKFQEPHVNRRADGSLYIMEGQHGTWAYVEFYGEGVEKYVPIEVWIYEGLTEQQEADFFLSFNNKKTVDAMSKFKVGVVAGREVETEIDRIVRSHGCTINSGNGGSGHAIQAVGALLTIHRQHGPRVLDETVGILHEALGEGSYERANLMGLAMVLARYNVNPADVTRALLGVRGGSKGLIQSANRIREAMGVSANDATAAAVVEAINKTRRGPRRLASWFAVEGDQ